MAESNTFIIFESLGALFLLGALFWMIESLWPDQPQQPRWRSDSLIDLIYWLFDGVVMRLLLSGLFLAVISITAYWIPRPTFSLVCKQPVWLQIPEILLLGDLIGYWVHRIMHRYPTLWSVHAIHHSSEHMDWLAVARVHPLESILKRVIETAPLYALGFSHPLLAICIPFIGIYPILLHANVNWDFGRFGNLIVSPRFHHWHHSSEADAIDKNFANLFPFWDILFGTAFLPKSRQPVQFGLLDEHLQPNLICHMIYPVKQWLAAVSKRYSRHSTDWKLSEKGAAEQQANEIAGDPTNYDWQSTSGLIGGRHLYRGEAEETVRSKVS